MSLENRLKRGLDAQAAAMDDNVSGALDSVRDRAAGRRRMRFIGAGLAAAAVIVFGVLAGPTILASLRDEDPTPIPPAGGDPTPTPSPSSSPSPTPTEEPPASFETRTVWLTSGEFLQSSVREVPVPVETSVEEALLDSLIGGANPPEAEVGYGSAIPPGTRVIDVQRPEDGLLIVDLSSEFDDGGGSLSMRARVAQIVWTLEPFAPKGVIFEIEGQPVGSLGGEGLILDGPQRSKDYEDLLAPITVEWPFPGATLTDLDTIRGTANTFEANVLYRVLGADGESVLVDDKKKPVEEWFTTATCGTGCRGTWEAMLDLDFDGIQEGVLEVYERSAENGEPINVVRIPVTLDPAADGE